MSGRKQNARENNEKWAPSSLSLLFGSILAPLPALPLTHPISIVLLSELGSKEVRMQRHAIASSEILFKASNFICLRLQIEKMFLNKRKIRTKYRCDVRGKN
jgi:hypothetical protein